MPFLFLCLSAASSPSVVSLRSASFRSIVSPRVAYSSFLVSLCVASFHSIVSPRVAYPFLVSLHVASYRSIVSLHVIPLSWSVCM
jgi:hypothetical protein